MSKWAVMSEKTPPASEYEQPFGVKGLDVPPPRPRKNSLYDDMEDLTTIKAKKAEKEIFFQTLHGFAEAFTAHGIHYIFEKGQSLICRFFWVLIVFLAFFLACFW
jgi:hypothetical protein